MWKKNVTNSYANWNHKKCIFNKLKGINETLNKMNEGPNLLTQYIFGVESTFPFHIDVLKLIGQ